MLHPTGANVTSIPCSQADEESFISNVDWFCYGCGDGRRFLEQQQQQHSTESPPSVTMSSLQLMQSAVKKVAGFGNAGRLTLLEERRRERRRKSRVRLDDDYGLQFFPLRTEDEGDYFCLVNGRDRPSTVTRVLVQGESRVLLFPFGREMGVVISEGGGDSRRIVVAKTGTMLGRREGGGREEKSRENFQSGRNAGVLVRSTPFVAVQKSGASKNGAEGDDEWR